MQFWNELEGQVIEGYPLRRLVRSEGRTAWFDSESAPNQPATLSLTESLTDADEVMQRLEAAKDLKDPNLISIGKIGRTHVGQSLLVYAAMEHADQDLSDVLRGQALSKEEARQVAEALVDGLTAIHKRGMIHGRVEPASVLAVGEAVKLRSDCLQLPGSTRAGDVAGVGATIFQAFTQRKAPGPDDPQINRLPAPFAEIVRNSLSARWGLQQIAAALRPAAVPTPAVGPSTIPAPRPPSASAPKPAAAVPTTAATTPPAPSAAVPPPPPPLAPSRSEAPSPASGRGFTPHRAQSSLFGTEDADLGDLDAGRGRPIAIYSIVAIAVILLLAWLFFRGRSQSVPPSGSASPSPAQLAPGAAPSNGNSPAPEPTESPAPAVQPSARPSAAAPAVALKHLGARHSESQGADSRPLWRVVVYTYHHQDQAQHKADEINHAHPDLNAEVFIPYEGQDQYLVTLGAPVDRDQAFQLRQHAINAGLPSDSYAQNFAH